MLSNLEHRLIAINIKNNSPKLSKKIDNVIFRLNATLYRINQINKIITLLETTPKYLEHIDQNVSENKNFIEQIIEKSFTSPQRITYNNIFENFTATKELNFEYNDFFTNAAAFIDCLVDILFDVYSDVSEDKNEYFYDFENFLKNKNNITKKLKKISYDQIVEASIEIKEMLINRRHYSVHRFANRLDLSINYKQIIKLDKGISLRENDIEITTNEIPQEIIAKITKIIENTADKIIKAIEDKIMPQL